MSALFQLTTQATEDLDDIWRFIAKGSREAADRVEMEIVATCRRLAGFPLIGHHRRDITPAGAFLDSPQASELRYRLPPRNRAVAGGRHSARQAGPGKDFERSAGTTMTNAVATSAPGAEGRERASSRFLPYGSS